MENEALVVHGRSKEKGKKKDKKSKSKSLRKSNSPRKKSKVKCWKYGQPGPVHKYCKEEKKKKKKYLDNDCS
jgi:hypothetical protein